MQRRAGRDRSAGAIGPSARSRIEIAAQRFRAVSVLRFSTRSPSSPPFRKTMKSPRYAILVPLVVAAACARHSGEIAGLTAGKAPRFETRAEVATNSLNHADYHVADFDGDGILDMAVASVTGELRVLIGNGSDFVVTQELQSSEFPIWMDGGDLDGDGDEDIVVVRTYAQTSDIWWNDGAGTFVQGPTLNVPANPLSVVVGDVNGDMLLDIVVSMPSSPQIRIFLGDGVGGFPTEHTFPMPAVPAGQTTSAFTAQIVDATRDGIVDLVVADPDQDRVLVWPGVQGGLPGDTYWQLDVPGVPAAIAVGDLSGDNLDDLIVTTFDTNYFLVITEILASQPTAAVTLEGGDEGASKGGPIGETRSYLSFQIDVPDRPTLATVADVTGDDLPDLVACLGFRASLFVAPQLPGGGVGEAMFYDANDVPLRPFVGDFDQNGQNDVFALSGLGDRINLWFADDSGSLRGARNFESGLPGASWMVGGDFDGDGDAEVVVGSDNGTELSVMGRGAGDTLVREFTFDVGAVVRQLEVADLDLDGRPDLMVGVDGGLRLLRNVSTGSGYAFEVPAGTPAVLGSIQYPFGATAADLDRDGDMDIAVCDFTGGSLHLLPGTADAFVYGTPIVIDLGAASSPLDVVAADFTGDGLQDLAVSRANLSDIAILRNDGGLQFSLALNVPVGNSPNYLITSDFNVDGRADLVVSNGSSGSVSVLFGQPSGFVGQNFAAGSVPTALLANDLSGDGLPDILVASLVSGDFRVMVGDGTGGFPLLTSFPGTWGASNVVLQDMTQDGQADLLISSLVTHRVTLVRNITD